MSQAANEAVFLKRFVTEVLGPDEEQPITVFSASQSAIVIATNTVHRERTKHKFGIILYVNLFCQVGTIRLEHRESEKMIADVLTKPLPRGKFKCSVVT